MTNIPPRILKFMEENFPPETDLAGYVVCIANRDKTFTVMQGFDSAEVRDKVGAKLAEEIAKWPKSD